MPDTQASVTYEKGKLYQINLNELISDPNQMRKSMDEEALEELTASVREHGVLQPILFRAGNGSPESLTPGALPVNSLYIVAGERRVEAARRAWLTKIPAIFISGSYSEIALVENLLRQDLTAVEEAEGLQALMNEQQYTREQLGNVIGKARQTINDILTLNRLPEEIRDGCRGDRTIARNTLIAIARKKQARSMMTAYNAFRERQQKGKTARFKTHPNDPAPLFVLVNKTLARLNAVDMTDWPEDDMMNFQTLIASLKEWIDAFQADPVETPSRFM